MMYLPGFYDIIIISNRIHKELGENLNGKPEH